MKSAPVESKVIGSGKPLVLLHAFPLSNQLWLDLKLPAGFQIILPNYPGFGNSALVPSEVFLPDAAQLLKRHLEGIGVKEPFVLGGISMGGYWALEFLRQYPVWVEKLVLISTRAGQDQPEGRQKRIAMAEKVEREGTAFLPEAMIPGLLGQTTRRDRPDIVDRLAGWIRGAPPKAVSNAQLAMANRLNQMDLLPKIKVSSLVLAGLEDSLIPPSEAENMAKSIPGACLKLIPQVGHLIPLEAPESFQKVISEFLR